MMTIDNIVMTRFDTAVEIFLEAGEENDTEMQLVVARWIDSILSGNHKPLNAERPSPELAVWQIIDGTAGGYYDTWT